MEKKTIEELNYEERVILQKCDKIREMFREIVAKQGDGDVIFKIMHITIFEGGYTSVFAIKRIGGEESDIEYYTNFAIKPDEEGGVE